VFWSRLAAGVYLVAGALHFTHTKVYASIVPPYLPAHRELVYASGVAEMAGGAGLLHPSTRKPAGWWLIATLIAVFPANVHMAVNWRDYPKVPGGRTALLLRLPFQLVFIALVRAGMRD
jgi:uncharacterized membrane protein